ncbi:MAG: S1 RNA-binding domain-containing protein [Caldilineaceae bacterium]|nr:S1 RNA-binding domain-containing protein [Caldilineaceae bacterium]
MEGTVAHSAYGAFIDIGVGRDALLHVREMSEGFVKRPEDVVTLGETIEARIVSLSRRRQRIDLSLRVCAPSLRQKPQLRPVKKRKNLLKIL